MDGRRASNFRRRGGTGGSKDSRWTINLRATGLLLVLLASSSVAASYGSDKSQQECRADAESSREALLLGGKEPYAWWGPSDECYTEGCNHAHWGKYCRFDWTPSCPHSLRKELTAWLRKSAQDGAQWALDALLLQPCDLWPLVQGRNVWVAGDSMSNEMAYTITCFLIEYMLPDAEQEDERGPLPVYSETLIKELEDGVTNKRVAYWCKMFQENTRVCYLNADRADHMAHVLRMLPTLGTPDDVLIMNLGMHYKEMNLLKQDIEAIAGAVDAHRSRLPRFLYWKETTPQHYLTKTGFLNESIPVAQQRCYPAGTVLGVDLAVAADGALLPAVDSDDPIRQDPALHSLLIGGQRNAATKHAIQRTGMKVLPLWNQTLMLSQFHQHIHAPDSGGACAEIPCDCTHVCQPSWGQLALAGLRNLILEDASE